jgi:hypothetical protein
MSEPTSSVAAGASTAAALLLTSAAAGDYALIMLGGVAGVMHSISRVPLESKADGAWYVLRWVFTAVILTGGVSHLLERYAGFPAGNWPGVVAFSITFFADRWALLVDRLMNGIVDGVVGRLKGPQ